MRRVCVLATAIVAAACAVYAFIIAPRWLRVERLRVALPGLPPALRGVRIAHLTDLHAGGRGVSGAMLLRARRAALDDAPDIVALTGDYYDDGRPVATGGLYDRWPAAAQVFAVLGNHDFRGGPGDLERIERELVAGGARLLRNAATRVELRGQPTWLVGVDDPFTCRADEAAAFAQLPEGEDALLLLAHSPAAIDAVPLGRARLALSGHTHGGQLRILPSGRTPGVGLLRRITGTGPRREPPVYRGRHWLRGALLVISDGLGLSQLPARVRTRPTVLLVELDVAPSGDGPACDDAARFVTVLNPVARPWRWLS